MSRHPECLSSQSTTNAFEHSGQVAQNTRFTSDSSSENGWLRSGHASHA